MFVNFKAEQGRYETLVLSIYKYGMENIQKMGDKSKRE